VNDLVPVREETKKNIPEQFLHIYRGGDSMKEFYCDPAEGDHELAPTEMAFDVPTPSLLARFTDQATLWWNSFPV